MGSVPKSGRGCSAVNGSFLDSSQECVQHRQTHPGLAGKLLDVGPRDRNKWRNTSETVFGDHRINGAQVRLSRLAMAKGVPSTENRVARPTVKITRGTRCMYHFCQRR